jgi:hypothetical protein
VTATLRAAPRPARPWRAYARLARLDVFDSYLSVPLAWTMLGPAARVDQRNIGVLAAFLAGEILLMACLLALDDRARRARRDRPPAGALTEPQLVGLAVFTFLTGALLWTAAVLTADPPTWALAAAAVCLVLYPLYSWGLRLSYRGFQELHVLALGFAVVLVPYGLVAGGAAAYVVAQSLVFGLGLLLFALYANTYRVPADRALRRPTVAVLTSPRGNAAFIGLVSLAELGVIVSTPFAGGPWWLPLALAPTILLRVNQFLLAFRRRDLLRARSLGLGIHRVTVLTLLVVNLVVGVR